MSQEWPFELWYQQNKMVISEPTSSNIDVFIPLLSIKNLKPARTVGYRTAIADHLGHFGQEVSKTWI